MLRSATAAFSISADGGTRISANRGAGAPGGGGGGGGGVVVVITTTDKVSTLMVPADGGSPGGGDAGGGDSGQAIWIR